MATIKDVARHAGVSIATVSRVIRNQNVVTEKTQKKVLHSIRMLDFQPNILARQLRTQETGTIIVIVPDIGNSFFYEILRGIQDVANTHGFQVFIADMQNNPDVETHYLHALLQKQADGVISLSANVAQSLIERVASDFPLVIACQYMADSELPNVTIDNVSASKKIVEHLIGLGHRRIAHLSCEPNILLYRDRQNGYYQALAENGISIDLKLVQYGTSSLASGFEQMHNFLDLPTPPTAVFAAGDILAIGALKALKARGWRTPADCAVVGFDDIDLSALYDPALTTIRQPKRAMGELAMQMLLDIIQGVPLAKRQCILDYELVVRDSCGAALVNEAGEARPDFLRDKKIDLSIDMDF